jgi:hypothetical protein
MPSVLSMVVLTAINLIQFNFSCRWPAVRCLASWLGVENTAWDGVYFNNYLISITAPLFSSGFFPDNQRYWQIQT